MKNLKAPKIETSVDDDFIYINLIKLLGEVKLAQGGNELAYTLRNHKHLKEYLRAKQIERINHIETTYFLDDGMLNLDAIRSYYARIGQ